jgi:hypothetical protein
MPYLIVEGVIDWLRIVVEITTGVVQRCLYEFESEEWERTIDRGWRS